MPAVRAPHAPALADAICVLRARGSELPGAAPLSPGARVGAHAAAAPGLLGDNTFTSAQACASAQLLS